MTHSPRITASGEVACQRCFHDWPCEHADPVGSIGHDVLCPVEGDSLSSTYCGWCKMARTVRDHERALLLAQTQEAVASIDLKSAINDSDALAVIWRDGWRAGKDSVNA